MEISCFGNKTMAFYKCESRTAEAEVLEAKAPNPAKELTKVMYNYKMPLQQKPLKFATCRADS